MCDELVIDAVVPDDFLIPGISGTGDPLQHTTLLPVPGAALSELDPVVLVVRVHHANLDYVISNGTAMLESDLVAENEAAGLVELELVVVAEPMVFGPASDRSDGRVGCFRQSEREGREKLASVHGVTVRGPLPSRRRLLRRPDGRWRRGRNLGSEPSSGARPPLRRQPRRTPRSRWPAGSSHVRRWPR